jgi:hypothetical protein
MIFFCINSASLAKMRKLQQEYIYEAEDKMMEVEVVQDSDGTVLGLREDPKLDPMFPSTEELFDFVYDRTRFQAIKSLHEECLQKADEKVAIAQQAMELIDVKVQRLDHDLSTMETLLQVRLIAHGCFGNILLIFSYADHGSFTFFPKATGEFQSGVAAKPNDLAACQVTPGSEWILAKVVQQDMSTGMYKLADEDVESKKSTWRMPFGCATSCLVWVGLLVH